MDFLESQKIIEAHSIRLASRECELLNDFPETLVVYLETEYSPVLHHFIQRNLSALEGLYKKREQDFVFLPSLLQDITAILPRLHPGIKIDENVDSRNITTLVTGKLFEELGVPGERQGGMLLTRAVKGGVRDSGSKLADFMLTPFWSKEEGIPAQDFFECHASLSRVKINHPFQHNCISLLPLDYEEPEEPKEPEGRFAHEVTQIVSEIDERIKLLKNKGLFNLLTETIAPMLLPDLSRLRVTDDFKIFLTDYQNMEVEMNPLSKTVYFLFLRHPRGIFLRHLSFYRDELAEIYKLLSGRSSLDDMLESVKRLSDPSDNSIYEKCSRVKRAFLKNLSDDIARNYYISGAIDHPKSIALTASLIELPEALRNIPVSKFAQEMNDLNHEIELWKLWEMYH